MTRSNSGTKDATSSNLDSGLPEVGLTTFQHATARVGTSGWSHREWLGSFYPKGTQQGGFLAYYAQRIAAVELNATAYGLPKPGYLERWTAAVPAHFRMAIKAPQRITHVRRLRECEDDLREFLTALQPLGVLRGPLLFQLPPSLVSDVGLLTEFLELLQPLAEGLPVIFEFRNSSWYHNEIFRALDGAGAACCVHDMRGSELTEPRTGGLLYLRRHGTAGRYAGAYSPEQIAADARLMTQRMASGQDAYAFFNNTMDGSAIENAEQLQTLVMTES